MVLLIAGVVLAVWFAAAPPARADLFRQSRLPVPAGRFNHAPGIVKLPSGQLLACWDPGSFEANPDVVILCSTSGDAGKIWSAPRHVAGSGEQARGRPRRTKAPATSRSMRTPPAASG
jgi:hypothetical protein